MAQLFFCTFCKISKYTFFTEELPVAAFSAKNGEYIQRETAGNIPSLFHGKERVKDFRKQWHVLFSLEVPTAFCPCQIGTQRHEQNWNLMARRSITDK